MTFTFLEIILILLFHYLGDFWLQNTSMAKGKSKEWKYLLQHTITYTVCWMPFLAIMKIYYDLHDANILLLFLPITFILHTATDYFTSRLNSKLWQQGKSHEFFIAVGGDQILHYIQLFLTYKILLNYAC